jgi:hypothetical protein
MKLRARAMKLRARRVPLRGESNFIGMSSPRPGARRFVSPALISARTASRPGLRSLGLHPQRMSHRNGAMLIRCDVRVTDQAPGPKRQSSTAVDSRLNEALP